MMDTTCRRGDFFATFSVELDSLNDARFKMVTRYRRYQKTYYFVPRLREGDTIIPELRRFISSLLDEPLVNTFFQEANRESQLREGYYRALDNMRISLY